MRYKGEYRVERQPKVCKSNIPSEVASLLSSESEPEESSEDIASDASHGAGLFIVYPDVNIIQILQQNLQFGFASGIQNTYTTIKK